MSLQGIARMSYAPTSLPGAPSPEPGTCRLHRWFAWRPVVIAYTGVPLRRWLRRVEVYQMFDGLQWRNIAFADGPNPVMDEQYNAASQWLAQAEQDRWRDVR